MNINFPDDHTNPKDCQLLLALTGTKEEIIYQLEKIAAECKGNYGKPYMGTTGGYGGYKSVITPIWKGKEY